jgi:hypothetical protein
MYFLGRGVVQSNVEAALWFRKAADQGHAEAKFSLGNMFHEGRGVAQNIVEGTRWFRKAADQGHLHAQFALDNI